MSDNTTTRDGDLVGYDCDGVLVPLRVVVASNAVIISGRLYNEWQRTVAEVGHLGLPIYLRPNGQYGDVQAAGLWKATMINMLGVRLFHEDDQRQIEVIERNCPNCRVIRIQ